MTSSAGPGSNARASATTRPGSIGDQPAADDDQHTEQGHGEQKAAASEQRTHGTPEPRRSKKDYNARCKAHDREEQQLVTHRQRERILVHPSRQPERSGRRRRQQRDQELSTEQQNTPDDQCPSTEDPFRSSLEVFGRGGDRPLLLDPVTHAPSVWPRRATLIDLTARTPASAAIYAGGRHASFRTDSGQTPALREVSRSRERVEGAICICPLIAAEQQGRHSVPLLPMTERPRARPWPGAGLYRDHRVRPRFRSIWSPVTAARLRDITRVLAILEKQQWRSVPRPIRTSPSSST